MLFFFYFFFTIFFLFFYTNFVLFIPHISMFCGNAEKVVQRNFVRTQDCVGNYGEIVDILLEENKVLKKKKTNNFSFPTKCLKREWKFA